MSLSFKKKLTPEDAKKYLGTHSKKNLLDIIGAKPVAEVLTWIDEFNKTGGNTKALIEELLQNLHGALLNKSGIAGYEEFETSLTPKDLAKLMKYLNEAYGYLRVSPVESIPLEIAIVEFYNETRQS